MRVPNVSGVEGRNGLEDQDMSLIRRDGFVLDTARNDEELSFFEIHDAVSHVNAELAFEDQEEFVFVLMVMPDELPRELHNLHMLAVELADDAWAPRFRKLFKLVGQVHFFVLTLAHIDCLTKRRQPAEKRAARNRRAQRG